MSKVQRHHQITQLLSDLPISSQLDLVKELEDVGMPATQATVSRDLEELGAVKVRLPNGELIYAIPEYPVDRVLPEDHLRRVMGCLLYTSDAADDSLTCRSRRSPYH